MVIKVVNYSCTLKYKFFSKSQYSTFKRNMSGQVASTLGPADQDSSEVDEPVVVSTLPFDVFY